MTARSKGTNPFSDIQCTYSLQDLHIIQVQCEIVLGHCVKQLERCGLEVATGGEKRRRQTAGVELEWWAVIEESGSAVCS